MEYNKYQKINDKKILHKKGKRWITLSIGIMAMLGGTLLAKQENVHADANNQNNQQSKVTQQNTSQKTNLVQQHNTQPTQAKQQSNKQNTKNISAQASVLHKAIVNNAARSAMQNANNKTVSQVHKHALLGSNNTQSNNDNWIYNKGKYLNDNSVTDWQNSKEPYYGLNYRYSPSKRALEFTDGTLTWNGVNNWNSDNTKGTPSDVFIGSYGTSSNDVSSPNHIKMSKIDSIKFDNDVNTSNVTNMAHMLDSVENLKSLDFGNNFDTHNVTNMSDMIGDGEKLIIFSKNFDTSNVKNMYSMFHDPMDSDSDTTLQFVTIQSPNTKFNEYSGISSDLYNANVPTLNGKPYAFIAPNDFSQGNVGTFIKSHNMSNNSKAHYSITINYIDKSGKLLGKRTIDTSNKPYSFNINFNTAHLGLNNQNPFGLTSDIGNLLRNMLNGNLIYPDVLSKEIYADYKVTPSDKQTINNYIDEYQKGLPNYNNSINITVQPTSLPSSDSIRQRYNYLIKYENSDKNIYAVKPDITHGIPGKLSLSYKQHILDWLNFFRSLFNLPPTVDNSKLDTLDQYGADGAHAIDSLRHGLGGMSNKPNNISTSDWQKGVDTTSGITSIIKDVGNFPGGDDFYTDFSNMSLGLTTPFDIAQGYMRDDNNEYAGHRISLLLNHIACIGIGKDSNFNTLNVIGSDSNSIYSRTTEYPMAGQFPYKFSNVVSDSMRYFLGHRKEQYWVSPWSIQIPNAEVSDPENNKKQVTIHDDTANINVPLGGNSDNNIPSDNLTSQGGNFCFTPNARYIKPNHTYTVTLTDKYIPNGQFTYTTRLYSLGDSDSNNQPTPQSTTPQSSGSAKPTSTSTNTMPSSSVPTTPQSSSVPSTPQQSSSSNIPTVQSARPEVVSSSSTTPPTQSSSTPVQPTQSSSASSTPEPQAQQTKHTEQRQSMPTHHESLAQQHKSPSDQEVKREQEINTKGATEHSDTTDNTDTHTDDINEQPSNDATDADYSKPTTTNSSIKQGSTTGTSQNNQNKLPQTNEQNQFHKELGAILLSIGLSAGAFGKAIDKRRRY